MTGWNDNYPDTVRIQYGIAMRLYASVEFYEGPCQILVQEFGPAHIKELEGLVAKVKELHADNTDLEHVQWRDWSPRVLSEGVHESIDVLLEECDIGTSGIVAVRNLSFSEDIEASVSSQSVMVNSMGDVIWNIVEKHSYFELATTGISLKYLSEFVSPVQRIVESVRGSDETPAKDAG